LSVVVLILIAYYTEIIPEGTNPSGESGIKFY